MTGPSLDLDALRKKAEKATPGPWAVSRTNMGAVYTGGLIVSEFARHADAAYIAAASPDVILAVLTLVDEQRERINKLEEERDKWRRLYVAKMNDGLAFAIETAEAYPADEAPELHAALRALNAALAGSPAEKEPLALDGLEWSWEYEPHERRLTVRARIRGQSVWRDVLAIDQAELR